MSRKGVRPASKRILLQERRDFARFARRRSEPVYRHLAERCYRFWEEFNDSFFSAKLNVPHITFGRTAPRSLGSFKPLTDFGGDAQITINEGVVFGWHRIVLNPWPAEGTVRFVEDILRHEMIHQWQREVANAPELGHRGHGRVFCEKANEIGVQLGLPAVVTRNRGGKCLRQTCVHWPHSVRADGYYLADVDFAAWVAPAKPRHVPDWLVLFETILALIQDGKIAQLKRMLQRDIARLKDGNYSSAGDLIDGYEDI